MIELRRVHPVSVQRRSEANLLRCTLPAAGHYPRLARPILLAKPLRHPLLDFFLVEKLATLSRLATATDRLLNVDMVVDVFERRFIRKRLEQSSNLFFRPTHTRSFYRGFELGCPAATQSGLDPGRLVLGKLPIQDDGV